MPSQASTWPVYTREHTTTLLPTENNESPLGLDSVLGTGDPSVTKAESRDFGGSFCCPCCVGEASASPGES